MIRVSSLLIRDVNDNKLVSNLYSLTGIYNLNVIEPEGIGAAEGMDLRAGPVSSAAMSFKNLFNDECKQPYVMIRGEVCL